MSVHSPFTVIVPAHNEAAVIARSLHTLLEGAPSGHCMQVIVAANGCTDRTVEIARKSAPQALLIELPQGSKTHAMNAAAREASHFPRIYLDADVQCDYHSLAAIADVLRQPGVMAASPALKIDLSRSSWLVRAYYRVWLTQPYATCSMVGSGCFGLSRSGYELIGDFPDITGDDIWVHSRFSESERRNISVDRDGQPVCFVVSPPRSAIDQIRVETRRRLGNKQVDALYPSPRHAGSNSSGDLGTALRQGASFFDLAIYIAIKGIVRLRASWMNRRSTTIVWERDTAARELGRP